MPATESTVKSISQAEAALAAWQPPTVALRDGRSITIKQFPYPAFERLYQSFAGDVLPLFLAVLDRFAAEGEDDNPSTQEVIRRIAAVAADQLPALLALPGFVTQLIWAAGLGAEEAAQLSVADSLKLATAALSVLVVELSEVGGFFGVALSGARAALPFGAPSGSPSGGS